MEIGKGTKGFMANVLIFAFEEDFPDRSVEMAERFECPESMDAIAVARVGGLDELGERWDDEVCFPDGNLVDGRAHFPEVSGSEMIDELGR